MAVAKSANSGWGNLPVYTRVTIVGLIVFALVLLTFGIIFSIKGEDAIFALIFGIPTLVFAGLAWRFGKWTLLLAAAWALINLGLNGFYIVPSLGQLNSFFDFGFALPVLIGLILALAGGIVAFVQQRRGTARTTATKRERAVFGAIAVMVVGLMVISGILQITGQTSVSAEEKAGATLVEMKNTEFKPEELQMPSGQPAKLVIKNKDLFIHTFTIKELGIDVTILGGSERLIGLPTGKAGSFKYVCTVTGHEAMKGTLLLSQ